MGEGADDKPQVVEQLHVINTVLLYETAAVIPGERVSAVGIVHVIIFVLITAQLQEMPSLKRGRSPSLLQIRRGSAWESL